MAVNLSKNQYEITKAWRNVVESTQEQNWALFGYEGSTNVIRLMSTGSKGLEELVVEFNCSLIQYAFCRIIDDQVGLNMLVLINWQGESAPLSRKGLCASHVGDVANYFKGCSLTITIRNDDEATKCHLMEQIMKTSASKINLSRQRQLKSSNDTTSSAKYGCEEAPVKNSSISGHKVDIASDLAANRKTFWQQQEEEEKERLAEEKRRAAERQAQFERERQQREASEAKKLAQTIEERNRLIDATRQADRKASINNSAALSSSSNSQPNSIISSSPVADAGDDDGRVGRRSELIRLERNQETQSLITRGLIKNKRAIFEEQATQANRKPQQTTSARRASGAIITQRLNVFKSLDVSTTSETLPEAAASLTPKTVVNKLANGFVKKVSVSGSENEFSSGATPIKKEVEAVELTNDEDEGVTNVSYNNGNNQFDDSYVGKIDQKQQASPKVINDSEAPINELTGSPSETNAPIERQVIHNEDVNGNSRHNNISAKQLSVKDSANKPEPPGELLLANEKHSEAIALFDYEAADSTEISFDPDDKIGFIQKVDPGWWQGKVMSGRFKGQIGLFPSNYVREI